ncbi:hypothetical protein [Heyndrickxia coagulans]|uniref:hypothetical protein n=1 Tax=Heyndrickxia coagulans TaxID=1398 RepID=UPI001C530F7E|nr:hypothetical protein [Heyndrickxia coagulans]
MDWVGLSNETNITDIGFMLIFVVFIHPPTALQKEDIFRLFKGPPAFRPGFEGSSLNGLSRFSANKSIRKTAKIKGKIRREGKETNSLSGSHQFVLLFT